MVLTCALSINILGAMPTHASQDDATAQLVKLTEGSKLLVIGEMHGTQETPALVADIVKQWTRKNGPDGKGQPVIVALEYPQTEAGMLTDYFNSDGRESAKKQLMDSPFWSRAFQDGRSSEAILALIDSLRILHQSGKEIHIAVFDLNAAQIAAGQDRDLGMSTNLRAIVHANPSAKVLALMGNFHARQQDSPTRRFMVAYLKDLAPFSLKVDAYSGQYWMCSTPEPAGCKATSFERDADEHRPLGLYLDAETKAIGYSQALMLDRFSASPAARK